MRDQLDGLVTQMVERGILFEEAVEESEDEHEGEDAERRPADDD